MWNLKNPIWPQKIHAASSWGGTDNEFSSRGGTKSHPFIWAGSRGQRSGAGKPQALFQTQNPRCSENHSFKCHHGPCFWFMRSETPPYMWLRWPHVSLLRSQERKMATRTSGPTSSAESGGHLPHCQTPARGRNDKMTTKGANAAALQSLNHQRLL